MVNHSSLLFKAICVILLTVDQISAGDKLYPNLSCHKGYDTVGMMAGHKYNADVRVQTWHDTCMRMNTQCYKQCMLQASGFLNEDKGWGLQDIAFLGEDLWHNFFLSDEDKAPYEIANKIYAECGKLGLQKIGEKVPLAEATKPSCEGLEEFHACLEKAWKC